MLRYETEINMKKYYTEQVHKTVLKLKQFSDCFSFAVVTDSHLDNSLCDTLENIKAVENEAGFSCVVHLGDFLNGSYPKKLTSEIMKEQMKQFINASGNAPFYPVQGNHDGYMEMIGSTPNLVCDELWYEWTSFTDDYKNVYREGNKPYFYVDYPEEKIRLVILCTFYNEINGDKIEKIYGTDKEQIDWLENTALDINDRTVLIFSHDAPFEYFDERAMTENPRINGNLLADTVKRAEEKRGFTLAAWFVGHFHGDYIGKVNGINFILTGSQTAYVPFLWDMPEGGYYPERVLGTKSEDLWDAAVLDKKERLIRLFRFGGGADRELRY